MGASSLLLVLERLAPERRALDLLETHALVELQNAVGVLRIGAQRRTGVLAGDSLWLPCRRRAGADALWDICVSVPRN